MAYAAILSLSQILELMSNPYPKQRQTPLKDQQIKSLQENLNFLLDFLDDSWQRRSDELQPLEMKIRDAAYKTEDIIESHVSKNFGQESFHERQIRDQTFCENFVIVADEIDSIKTTAATLKKFWGSTDMYQSKRTSLPTRQSRLASNGKSAMVGFRDDLNQIVDRLTGHPPSLKVIPITGMGGIGKTTLATNVYNHPRIKEHFHIRAWASISQEYREREVLLSLLKSMEQLGVEILPVEILQEEDTRKLKEYLYKSLNGRSYLVVMDDVWTTMAWNSLSKIFPNDGNGSRIMLTTRQLSVVDSYGSSHHMRLLNATDSWNLLRQEVFGKDSCPTELKEAGKEIARNCKGLPLSLVTIGGHLSKAERTKDYWEYVAENIKSVVNAKDANCLDILSLSYDYLPHYLKACFLYMGLFPEDHKIRVSKLIKLWAAEGFLKPVRDKTLEEVAEEYLGDLISRNLILTREESSCGKIKTCSIHDLLRDLCIIKAQEEKFFHATVTDKDFRIFAEGRKYPRRLCIQPDTSNANPSMVSLRPVHIQPDTSNANPCIGSLRPVRSILCFHSAREIYESGDLKLFPLLKVLDLAKGKVDGFLIGEMKLVHSRYLAFSCDVKISIPKILPDFLWHLQTLIVDCDEVHLPEEIWRMPQLRHLLFGMCYIPCLSRSPIDGEDLVLRNLLTLSKVSSSSCTKEVFERVPNLNKLGILTQNLVFTPFSLGNLVNLPQLENLKIRGEYNYVSEINFTFPQNIKKLTLKSCRIPWEHMTIVGKMPNLEVLKLYHNAFDGPEWEPTDGEFCKLKFLLLHELDIVQWRADDTHFPSLERLILRRCFELKEISCSIGDTKTLKIIDLDDASPSAVTWAKDIQDEQKDLGNDSLQVRFFNMFRLIRRKRKEAEAEICVSNDDTQLLKATTQFRMMLSADKINRTEEQTPPIVIRLLEILDRDDNPQLQHVAALAIKCISNCSSDNTNILIRCGATPILVSLLSSPNDDLLEQALDVLGNFAHDSTKSRDHVLRYGVLTPLLAQFNDQTNLSIMRKATSTLSNIFLQEPLPQFEQVKSSLRPLAYLIHTDDKEVLKYACLALINLTKGVKDTIQVLVDAGAFTRLVELIQYPSPVVLISALFIIRNIISQVDDIQIQVIIDKGALPCLLNLLTQNYNNIFKKAICDIISSVIQRTNNHIQVKNFLLPLAYLVHTDDKEVLKFACWQLFLLTEQAEDRIQVLIDAGVFTRLVELIQYPSPVVFISVLLIIRNNISQVDDIQIQVIIDKGALPCLLNLLTENDNNSFKAVICDIISSIIRRTKDHIQAVIEAGIISPLLKLLQNADHLVQVGACRAILQAILKGTNEQIKFLVHEGCIKPFCDLIVSPNQPIIIKYCLIFLENIMKVGEAEKNQDNTEDMNVFAWIIKDAGGVQKIKDLQTHDDRTIRIIAKKLLVKYWQEEEEEEDGDDDDDDDDEEDEDEDEDEDDDDHHFEEEEEDDDDDDDEDSDAKPNTPS